MPTFADLLTVVLVAATAVIAGQSLSQPTARMPSGSVTSMYDNTTARPLVAMATVFVVTAASFGLWRACAQAAEPESAPALRPGEPAMHEVHLAVQHLPVLISPHAPGR